MAGPAFVIDVDASELDDKINMLKATMKPEQFNRAMYGIFQRTGRHVSRILRQDLPQEYEVKPSLITKAVKRPKLTMGGLGVGCSIPISDVRGSIGDRYRASGGAHGWNSLRRKYRVKARIVKDGQSTLPERMTGSYPPFRNLGSKLGGVTYTRKTKKRGPILKVMGIAIPQMPMNRSEEDVQRDILLYMQQQIDQRLMALIRFGK